MQSSFAPAMAFTAKYEGGYSSVTSDPGNYVSGVAGVGPLVGTNAGISAPVLQQWMKRQTVTAAIMRALPASTRNAIFSTNYWLPINGDTLPAGVDLMVWDHGVNCGVRTSAELLQEIVGFSGTELDGFIGADTLAAVDGIDDTELVDLLDADALHKLQQALGVTTDGVLQPATQKALAVSGASRDLLLVTALATSQEADYRSMDNFAIDGAGWLARLDARQAAAYALILGSASPATAPEASA